jgi:hypothetical protein
VSHCQPQEVRGDKDSWASLFRTGARSFGLFLGPVWLRGRAVPRRPDGQAPTDSGLSAENILASAGLAVGQDCCEFSPMRWGPHGPPMSA